MFGSKGVRMTLLNDEWSRRHLYLWNQELIQDIGGAVRVTVN